MTTRHGVLNRLKPGQWPGRGNRIHDLTYKWPDVTQQNIFKNCHNFLQFHNQPFSGYVINIELFSINSSESRIMT